MKSARATSLWLHPVWLLVCAVLAGCVEPVGALVGASVAAVPVLGRSLPDVVVSGITGRDCSVVRLDQGKTYCKDAEALPAVAPICTRSLGTVDCWSNPEAFGMKLRSVADGPRALTPEQEANRTRRWPGW